MQFTESVRSGLRIEGSEMTVEGVRHRRRYAWAANRIRELKLSHGSVILDHGCGSGHGCRILRMALPHCAVMGFDPDPEAVKYAQAHWHPDVYADASIIPPTSVIVTHGVLEHIKGVHPGDMLEEFLRQAPYVVGFFPYLEKPGINPHHFWFGLHEGTLPPHTVLSTWYEPAEPSMNEKLVDAFYLRTAPPSFFQTGNPRDAINILFVLERVASAENH